MIDLRGVVPCVPRVVPSENHHATTVPATTAQASRHRYQVNVEIIKNPINKVPKKTRLGACKGPELGPTPPK